jgi:hypothetical protein
MNLKTFLLILCCNVTTLQVQAEGVAEVQANNLPPYVQTQVANLDLQIKELKLQRDQLAKQLENPSLPELQRSQLLAEIKQLNTQIQFSEQQKERLLQGN